MDRKCQDCIAIASASVVTTAAITATVDLADLVIHSTLAASTLISIAPAYVSVAAITSQHRTVDATVHVPAIDTAPVADGSLDIYTANLGLQWIPSPLHENEVADPWRPPRSSGPTASAQGNWSLMASWLTPSSKKQVSTERYVTRS